MENRECRCCLLAAAGALAQMLLVYYTTMIPYHTIQPWTSAAVVRPPERVSNGLWRVFGPSTGSEAWAAMPRAVAACRALRGVARPPDFFPLNVARLEGVVRWTGCSWQAGDEPATAIACAIRRPL
eukprot:361684-Chlamydomonas_euryale.AAC.7